MLCACEIMQLFSVVFCVNEAVHKFNFGLLKVERLKNGDQYLLQKLRHVVKETCFRQGLYVFPPLSSRALGDFIHTV